MSIYRLDECLDDKRFALECNAESKQAGHPVTVNGFPRALKGKEDCEILPILMIANEPLVTKDRNIAALHAYCIPDGSPGIIIVANAPGIPQTMTIKQVAKILVPFKASFPGWPRTPLRNSVITITQEGVDVRHVIGNRLISDSYLPFDAGWQAKLTSLLERNASRA
jgi:hypothetical protein